MAQPQRLPFVLVACDHGTVILNRLDWRKVSDTHNELGVGTDILVHGSFDLDLISICGGLLQVRHDARGSGVVALDCGANIGIYTLEWARLMADWGVVLAFEPQEHIFYALAGNIVLNNLFNAHAFHRAVGDKLEVVMMPQPDYRLPGQFGGLSMARPANIGQTMTRSYPVSVVTIDSLNLRRVDFIKADVEGMEAQVLTGARETIERDRPYVLAEWHITGKEPIEACLAPFGYETITVGMNLLCGPTGDAALGRMRALIEGDQPT